MFVSNMYALYYIVECTGLVGVGVLSLARCLNSLIKALDNNPLSSLTYIPHFPMDIISV